MNPLADLELDEWTVQLTEFWPWFVLLALGVVTLLAVRIVLRRRRKTPAAPDVPNLRINVRALSQSGPNRTGPRLELYHVPVRLAVLVLAPTGRGAELPSNEQLPSVVDQIAPNMMQILRIHQPLFRRWPAQLSTQGFSTTFFANVDLPGEHGKGTPWCAMAGRIEYEGQKLLVGMALCAASSNGLGHISVERETDWLDLLRVVNTHGQG